MDESCQHYVKIILPEDTSIEQLYSALDGKRDIELEWGEGITYLHFEETNPSLSDFPKLDVHAPEGLNEEIAQTWAQKWLSPYGISVDEVLLSYF